MTVTTGELESSASGVRTVPARRFAAELVHGATEAADALRLRFRVFRQHLMAGMQASNGDDSCDRDHFDQFCDHLIVRDLRNGQVAGTYRLLGPEGARQAGGYYSETEFDLRRLRSLKGRILEIGRACVDPDYRSGVVISALWAGLFEYINTRGYDYIMGCGSIPLTSGRRQAAAICDTLIETYLSPADLRANPYRPYPVRMFEIDREARERAMVAIPPLIKGYLRLGAWVCGQPAWDADFEVADLLILLPMARLSNRYANHYRRGSCEWPPSWAS